MSKTPRWTDAKNYPHGYRRAAETNIRLTFKRARDAEEAKRLRAQEIEREQSVKVRKLTKEK